MIKVKHPDPACNQQQEERLQNAPTEERRFHELLYTVGNITYRYHQRAKEFHPTLADWQEWLEGLPQNLRKDMEQKGFQQGTKVLSFTRYVMEKNDIGLEEYLRQHMDPQDYQGMISGSEHE